MMVRFAINLKTSAFKMEAYRESSRDIQIQNLTKKGFFKYEGHLHTLKPNNLKFIIKTDSSLAYQQTSGIWNTLLTTLELLCASLQKLQSGTWQCGSLYWQLGGCISGQILLLHPQEYTVSESCKKYKSEWNIPYKLERTECGIVALPSNKTKLLIKQ